MPPSSSRRDREPDSARGCQRDSCTSAACRCSCAPSAPCWPCRQSSRPWWSSQRGRARAGDRLLAAAGPHRLQPASSPAVPSDGIPCATDWRRSPTPDLIAIHDAARPFVTRDAVEAAIAAAGTHGAAIVAIPATDTVKLVGADRCIESTPPRTASGSRRPQVFARRPDRAPPCAARRRCGDGRRRSSSAWDTGCTWLPALPTTERSRRPTTWRGRSGT